MNAIDVLRAVPSTEPANFSEFCEALGSNCPTERDEWADLFQQLEHLQSVGLVEVERGFNNRIEALQLTAEGAAHVRDSNGR